MKEKRQKEVKKRKNFFPTLAVTIGLWLTIGLLIYFVNPDTPFILPVFFLLVWLAILFPAAIIFTNTKRGIIISSALTIFLILKYFGVGNILNLILLAGIALAFLLLV